MAWTDPRTWTSGELVTDTIMNTHVRDNLNAIGPHIHLRKTADESVTSSVVLQNDDHLFFSIAANEIWIVQFALFYQAAQAGDLQVAWTVPAGCTGIHGGQAPATTTTDGTNTTMWTRPQTSFATALLLGGDGAANCTLLGAATFVNGATAGTVQLQWAQNTSSATATTVRANSYLLAHRF